MNDMKSIDRVIAAPSLMWGGSRWRYLSVRVLVVVCCVWALSGCSTLSYYWQSINGHLAVMQAARSIDSLVADEATPTTLRARLRLAQRIREFASADLALPSNASYTRYADLRRSAVVWNVVAAPPYSLQLKTWCFAVVGCVGYRGYYSEADAKAEAEKVKAQGFEVNVYGVPAYSTLGYLNWAGGDPLLSTFIMYPEGELARMIFHELAHQVLYVKDDTVFNESFATAVERLGGQQWLARHGSPAAQTEYAAFDNKRREFRALTLRTRERLNQVYRQNAALSDMKPAQDAIDNVGIEKQRVMQQLREEYAQLKASWGGFAGYDRFIANANNASLGALAAYDDLVPQFEAVFEKQARSWPAFFAAIQGITSLAPKERRQALQDMTK
jgi:predicted aminopeptidase